TPDTHFVVYMNAKDPTPTQELHSRESLAPVFADLNQYAATMHFVGQSTILVLTGDRATGEAYTLAPPLTMDDGRPRLRRAGSCYNDTFVKTANDVTSSPATNVLTPGQKRLVIVGATGMVGGYALRYALEQPAVGRV